MKILIAEDDLTSRKFLFQLLSKYGMCDLTINGIEALDAFIMALNEEKPYDLVCLDIMMPKIDGLKALKAIRDIEHQKGVEPDKRAKIIMTTALTDTTEIYDAFKTDCEAYVAKPIDTSKLLDVMRDFRLIE